MKNIKDWFESFAIALVIVLPISFFCRPTMVKGQSMQPTLSSYNIVITEKKVKDIKRGEVVIFDARPFDNNYYIKRVIGLPGDTVEIKNGYVYIDDTKIEESYLKNDTYTDGEFKIIVPEGEVFVLGDNRGDSMDSRLIGTVPYRNIKGHAYFKIFPFNKSGKI